MAKPSTVLIVLLLITLLSSCNKNNELNKKYQSKLIEGINNGYPGIIVGIERDGNLWFGSEGFSNLEEQTPMHTNEKYHLASITKLFTAVAILKLVDDEKLNLNEKALTYLDSSIVNPIPYINEIKIGQLLDHSSGIYSFNNDMEYLETLIGKRAFENVKWFNKQYLSLAYGERAKPQGKPGSGNFYGDTNYILLGQIIEKVSGKPFRQYIKDTILTPLNLKDTGFIALLITII